jgi:hypothetical protein
MSRAKEVPASVALELEVYQEHLVAGIEASPPTKTPPIEATRLYIEPEDDVRSSRPHQTHR